MNILKGNVNRICIAQVLQEGVTMMHVCCLLFFWSCINMVDGEMLCNSRLALQWPRTVCLRFKCNGTSNCKIDIKNRLNGNGNGDGLNRLTVHGLWERGTQCNHNGGDYDENQIEQRPNLEQEMPGLLDGEDLWKHEWERHGKLTGLTIAEYFNKILELYGNYGGGITESVNGICKPGQNGMTVENFSTCIMEGAGIKSPLITLFEGFLLEIRICFYKNFTLMDCANRSNDDHLLKLPPVQHIQKRSVDDKLEWSNLTDDDFAGCPLVTTKNAAVTIFTRESILLPLLLLVVLM